MSLSYRGLIVRKQTKQDLIDYVIGFFNTETQEEIEIVVSSHSEKLAIEAAAFHLTSNIDSTFLMHNVYIIVDDLSKVTFH